MKHHIHNEKKEEPYHYHAGGEGKHGLVHSEYDNPEKGEQREQKEDNTDDQTQNGETFRHDKGKKNNCNDTDTTEEDNIHMLRKAM